MASTRLKLLASGCSTFGKFALGHSTADEWTFEHCAVQLYRKLTTNHWSINYAKRTKVLSRLNFFRKRTNYQSLYFGAREATAGRGFKSLKSFTPNTDAILHGVSLTSFTPMNSNSASVVQGGGRALCMYKLYLTATLPVMYICIQIYEDSNSV